MKRSFEVASIAGLALCGMIATVDISAAMPVGAAAPSESASLVQHVAWGCGPGFHPNPWGRCVPNGWGRPWGWHHWHHWHHWRHWGWHHHWHHW